MRPNHKIKIRIIVEKVINLFPEKKKKIEGKDLASSIMQVIPRKDGESEWVFQEREKMHRMATMGRLAEIGVADWEIENGKSFYSLNTK